MPVPSSREITQSASPNNVSWHTDEGGNAGGTDPLSARQSWGLGQRRPWRQYTGPVETGKNEKKMRKTCIKGLTGWEKWKESPMGRRWSLEGSILIAPILIHAPSGSTPKFPRAPYPPITARGRYCRPLEAVRANILVASSTTVCFIPSISAKRKRRHCIYIALII